MKHYHAAGTVMTNSHDQSWKIHTFLSQPGDQTLFYLQLIFKSWLFRFTFYLCDNNLNVIEHVEEIQIFDRALE